MDDVPPSHRFQPHSHTPPPAVVTPHHSPQTDWSWSRLIQPRRAIVAVPPLSVALPPPLPIAFLPHSNFTAVIPSLLHHQYQHNRRLFQSSYRTPQKFNKKENNQASPLTEPQPVPQQQQSQPRMMGDIGEFNTARFAEAFAIEVGLKLDDLKTPTTLIEPYIPDGLDHLTNLHPHHEDHLPLGIEETEEEQQKHWFVGSIDQGTTSSRFLIFNGEGDPVASYQIEFENLYPKSGYVCLPNPRPVSPGDPLSRHHASPLLRISRSAAELPSPVLPWHRSLTCIDQQMARARTTRTSQVRRGLHRWGNEKVCRAGLFQR